MVAAACFTGTIGLRGEAEMTVKPEDTAAHVSGGVLPAVLSTPRLLQLVEDAAYHLADRNLEDGYTSVGYEVVVEHVAPSEIGDDIVADVLLEAAEDRDLIFRFTVHDKATMRDVARGTQTRRIVLMDDFMRKLKKDRSLL
jgi:predicted thioesterase